MKKLLFLLTGILSVTILFAQRTVTGKVTDDKGVPLANASVTVKGTTTGTTTKQDGTYSLTVPSTAKTLIFSYVDMVAQEAGINSSSISVSLSPQGKNMDEVFVVAYGTQIKRKLTGSLTTVKSEELENRPFSSVDQMLQGKMPGVQSVSPNGQPGGAQTIRIRGVSSVTGSNDPLIVVDGVPVNSGDFSRLTNTSNALAGINPNDIESVTVLKDAASASIYGSRAANGVILITTKKGKAGKTKIKADAEFGFSNVAYQSDLGKPLNSTEYFELLQEGLVNAGATQAQVTSIMASNGFGNGYDVNWLDLITRQGSFNNYNISASGGDARTTFYSSIGYFKQQAPVIASDFHRYSGNLNIRHKASEKLAFGFNIIGSYVKQLTPTQSGAFRNPVLAGYFLRPSQYPYNADGSLNISNTLFNQTYNPFAIAELDRGLFNNIKTVSTISAEYEIINNLKLSSKFGLDYIGIEEERYDNPYHGDSRTTGGRIQNFNTRVANWVWTTMLDYHRDFLKSKDLGMDIKAGYESQKSKQYNISATGTGVPQTTLITLPTPTTPTQALGARTDFTQAAVFSIIQFDYQKRYSLSGSFRRDGSSRFPPDKRWGNFYSAGAAWNIDEEKFLDRADFINVLKLRASYGENGNNSGATPYGWRPTYAYAGASAYNMQPGSALSSPGSSADFTWEKNEVLNAAIDFSFLKDRVSGTVEYYKRKTSDLIFGVPVSRTTGTPGNSVQDNVGAMENKGWEIAISGAPVRTRDFRWDISFNISLNKNEVLTLPNNNADILAAPQIRRVGQNVTAVYTRLWAGVDPATGAGQWYADANKTKTTTLPSYRDIIGQSMPKGFGSFSTALSYKGLSLDVQFNYQYGHLVYDNWGFIMWSDGAFPTLNKIRKQLNRWQKPGDNAELPKYVYNNNSLSNAESSRWYYKGDFIRLREVTLSYQVPKNILDKARLSGATFYVRGNNLWTKAFDKKVPFDPEQGFNGINDLQVLISRTATIGVTVGL
ncbi:MAG TPA: SusC/RagA family TonB-linked outer membrane protein [Chitinophagaceae bacterium]|nr:SusC/RagA family TonB-linked outer membrane protein [Chitinophagaceae bacterium]